LALGHLDELSNGGGSTAGRQDVVHDQDRLAWLNAIGVHFERIGAILQGVLDGMNGVGKLFGFAHGDEASPKGQRHGRGEKVAARLNSNDDVDRVAGVLLLERLDGVPETGFVLEKGGDVVEIDAGFGPVFDLPDERFQVAGLGLRRQGDSDL